ncbi:hypothetical protein [Streptomonospora nanhaiensis]|uniref:ARB-07466-like C-terminal domain-containing protein n=1 Tax=Streptomonospora nanhaiensis TaxID=1323731 RepID=A0A853BSM4_9ACTN|nr:hypothetical protein [Streptomonospora nanhaiensis]MBV2362214.1 hypothetical protein [Streptomonospora nanhaiensis]NYI97332.1 hypothetical protein [Streptomonospora nanhaiensis]
MTIDPDELPGNPIGQGQWQGEQLTNAALIMNAGAELGLNIRDQTIGVMTAMGESSLIVIDHGDAAGPDSRGLFQQRDNGAWGDYEDRMDPTTSATMFFEKLREVDGREQMEPTLVAHEVQRNADAYHYAPYWEDAQAVVSALVGLDSVPLAARSCSESGGGAPRISEDCEPVASGIHPSACRAYAAIVAEFGQWWDPRAGVGCYDPREWDNGQGDHPVGQACDYMVAPGGQPPTPEMHARAVQVVQWLMEHHEALEIKYIIYDEAIWNPDLDPPGRWEDVRRFEPQYDANHVGITAAHVDHVHVSTGPWHNANGR